MGSELLIAIDSAQLQSETNSEGLETLKMLDFRIFAMRLGKKR